MKTNIGNLQVYCIYFKYIRIVVCNKFGERRFGIKSPNLAISLSWVVNSSGYNCVSYASKEFKIAVLSYCIRYLIHDM